MKARLHDLTQTGLERLERWIEWNGWAGYDPYDLQATPFLAPLNRRRWGRQLVHRIGIYAPQLARQRLAVKPQINAKAVGLLALGYLARSEASGQPGYRQRAVDCLDWLEANAQTGYAGACWGYPFDWHTQIEIPAGTPSGVVSSIAGQAFLEAYRLTGNWHYFEIARSTADFFLSDLNLDRVDRQRTCFSYTPLDQFHVHNANLFVAAHLYAVSAVAAEPGYAVAAEPAVRYTLAEQNEDGSWYYMGPPDKMAYRVDHYHTGFVLRCLDRICQASGRADWQPALDRGFRFYVENLLEPSGLPRFASSTTYPVDIHSCAEAILCLTQLGKRYPEAAAPLSNTLRWTLREMQAADGHFFYRKYRARKVRIAFMRWGQAWMFWALAAYANALDGGEVP
jgi:hypothetical protein